MTAGPQPRFNVGEKVTVAQLDSSGHIRTPLYCRGHTGIIERICGAYPNPEKLAYGKSGHPLQTLYRVRFMQKELWPDYKGRDRDSIEIEIYDHWLKPSA
jgi:nitrile hydratase